jgi:hypothetical protein
MAAWVPLPAPGAPNSTMFIILFGINPVKLAIYFYMRKFAEQFSKTRL